MIRHSVCATLKLSTRLALAFLLICFSGVSSSSQAQIFKVPFASLSPNYAPLWVADAAGLFRKYHLDVQPIYISSGSVVVPALLSGEVKIANISGAAAITAWARGADLALLAVSSDRLLHAVMTSANIKKPEDLKGKKVGSDRYGSLSDLALREALRYYKLSPDRDVAIIQTGGIPERLGALKVGAIDGAMLTGDSRLQAEKLGYRAVIELSELPIRYPSAGIVVTRPFLRNSRDTVKRFLKGWTEGIKIVKTDKNLTMKVLRKYLKTEDGEILTKTYEIYKDVHEKIPHPSRIGVAFALERLAATFPDAAKLRADDFLDGEIMLELEREGFIREIYSERPAR